MRNLTRRCVRARKKQKTFLLACFFYFSAQPTDTLATMNSDQIKYLNEAEKGTISILQWASKSHGPIEANELEWIWEYEACPYLHQPADSTRQQELDRLNKIPANEKHRALEFTSKKVGGPLSSLANSLYLYYLSSKRKLMSIHSSIECKKQYPVTNRVRIIKHAQETRTVTTHVTWVD